MTTNYDPIAEQYKRSKLAPWRTHIECFTLLDTLGDIRGKSVLDVACGEGFYTRLLQHLGAARTVGVDLSEGMIELAQKQEAHNPQGIEYHVGDGRDLPFREEFDVVVAGYLLNYAPDRNELLAMCRGIARSLKPGGRFVTVNCSPSLDFRTAPSYRQYGFETSIIGDWREGTPITWTFYLDDGPFSIENYHLSVDVHDSAFRQAGFSSVAWPSPRVSLAGEVEHGADFWRPFLSSPPIALIDCVK